MDITATADQDGNIFIKVKITDEKCSGGAFNLNRILKESLYKSGYPQKEEYRLTNAPTVKYTYTNAKR